MPYNILYHFRDHDKLDSAVYKYVDGPFDTYKDAIDERNWFFGHSPDVVQCWIERCKDNLKIGSILKQK